MDKKTKLSKNCEFRKAYNRGKSMASSCLVTYVVKNRLGFARYGITTGKKIGGAVQRNRARRVVRAAFFEIKKTKEIKNGYDIVFIARAKTCHVKMGEVFKTMTAQLKNLGVIS